jgi:hypothetical protein
MAMHWVADAQRYKRNGPQAIVLTMPAGLTRTLEGPRIELVPILVRAPRPASASNATDGS